MMLHALLRRLWSCKPDGSEIMEFAVSVPILVVLVVAIYDFGSAFTLKHKLSSAVLEGARIASGQHDPPNPLGSGRCSGAPTAICVVRDVVATDLQTAIGRDCGLADANGVHSSTLTWTFSGDDCSGFSLKIERDLLNPVPASLPIPFDTAPYRIENTKVTLVYPYQWQFNRAFKLLDPSANYLNTTITVSATMQNLD